MVKIVLFSIINRLISNLNIEYLLQCLNKMNLKFMTLMGGMALIGEIHRFSIVKMCF